MALVRNEKTATISGSLDNIGPSSYKKLNPETRKKFEDLDKDIQNVNGGTEGHKYGYNRKSNCVFCSFAYEMRRRGHDVQAQESLEGTSDYAVESMYESKRTQDDRVFAERVSSANRHIGMTEDEFKHMQDTILEDGDNSRGMISVSWKAAREGGKFSGGHELNYEVIDGVFSLVDCQVGKIYTGEEAYKYMKNAATVKTIRTDDIKIDEKAINKYYVEPKGDININKYAKRADEAAKVAVTSIPTATTLSLAGWGTMIGGGITGNFPLAMIGAGAFVAADVGGLLTYGISTGISLANQNKAKKLANEHNLALEKKWKDENRFDVYNAKEKKKFSSSKSAKHSFSSIYEEELYHHGILGINWGVRRYQNADGSLTDAGRKRYGVKVTDPGKAVSMGNQKPLKRSYELIKKEANQNAFI